MKTLVLAVAAVALAAGSAAAGPTSSRAAPHRSVLVGPEQPIPYGRLKAYLGASAKTRATKDWWSGSAFAATGSSTDVSATASGVPIDSPTPSAANAQVSSSQPVGAASHVTPPPSATSAAAPNPR
jgi:hypothetical protein